MGMLVVLLVGAIAMAFPGGSVAAQAPTPQLPGASPQPKDPQARLEKAGLRLERAFQLQQRMLEIQAQHFERVDARFSKIESMLVKAKANGKDTAGVEAVLAQLKTKETDAKKLHKDAARILKTHAGFDASCKVTDREAAKETLKDAGEKMKESRNFFGEVWEAVREAVKSWRESNPKLTK
ncbi:MAG: hypothetical protein Q7U74_15245 [Saprospiraceae bacterium]|nr:hypothetical protein [Saprospiraceae bacterium]